MNFVRFATTLVAVFSMSASLAMAADARIPFANHGGIYNWQVENDRSILIQSQSRKWYRATLFSSCFNLPFAEVVGFETSPSGAFDKFSAVRVHGQTCPVISLVETAAPAKKVKKPAAPPQPAVAPANAPLV